MFSSIFYCAQLTRINGSLENIELLYFFFICISISIVYTYIHGTMSIIIYEVESKVEKKQKVEGSKWDPKTYKV